MVDTNVLVSGLLRSSGTPGRIVQALATGIHHICHDERVLEEYHEVLRRPKFRFDENAVAALLEQLEDEGVPVICTPLTDRLPDPHDEKFLEVAIAGSAEFLITGNLRHFPERWRFGVQVVSPAEFTAAIRDG